MALSGALKEFAGPGKGYRLIQHPLAYTEVFVDPFVHLAVLARYAFALNTTSYAHGQLRHVLRVLPSRHRFSSLLVSHWRRVGDESKLT